MINAERVIFCGLGAIVGILCGLLLSAFYFPLIDTAAIFAPAFAAITWWKAVSISEWMMKSKE